MSPSWEPLKFMGLQRVVHDLATEQQKIDKIFTILKSKIINGFQEISISFIWGFPHSSVGKEYACKESTRDPSLIPGSGRSAGKGIGPPIQYSWTSLVAQLVKNLPTMWETWVWSLGEKDPLEKEKATHSSILAGRIPWTTVQGVAKSQTQLSNFHFHFHLSGHSVHKLNISQS